MYITYHTDVALRDNKSLSSIHHSCLHPDIQKVIEDNNETQKRYLIESNAWYTFIYLSTGNRIDISIK